MVIPRVNIFLLGLLAAIVIASSVWANDAASQFLEAYQEYTNAEQLEINGSYQDALAKYRYCVSLLEQIQRDSPDYAPVVIEYRLGKSRESVGRLSSAPTEAVAVPSSANLTTNLEGPLPTRDYPPGNRPAVPPKQPQSSRDLSAQNPVALPSISYRIPNRNAPQQSSPSTSPQAPPSPNGVSTGAYRLMEQELAFMKSELANARAQLANLDQRLLESTARERSALHATDRTKVEVVELKSRNAQMRQALADAEAAARAAQASQQSNDAELARLESELVQANANLEVANEANAELYAKLDDAAEYIEAADKIREQLNTERLDLAEQIRTGRDEQAAQLAEQTQELEAELKDVREKLAAAESENADTEILEATNAELTAKLEAAESKINELAALDPEREKLIAELRAELTIAKDAATAASNESASREEALAKLEQQLEETSRIAAVTTGAVAEENALLRNIISRQLDSSSKRAEARDRLISQIDQLELRSPDLDAIIASLATSEIQLTDDEKKLFTWRGSSNQAVSSDGPANFSIVVPKRDPESSAEPEVLSEAASELVAEARKFIDDGNPTAAVEVYRKLCESEPDNFFAQFNFAVVCHLVGNHAEAEQGFLRALELRPNDGDALTNLGAVRFRLGNVEGARSALADAISADPENHRAHYFLALSHSEEGDTDAAMLQLRRSLELEPDQPDAHLNLALLLATAKPPSIDAARKHYEIATALGAAPDASIEALLP